MICKNCGMAVGERRNSVAVVVEQPWQAAVRAACRLERLEAMTWVGIQLDLVDD